MSAAAPARDPDAVPGATAETPAVPRPAAVVLPIVVVVLGALVVTVLGQTRPEIPGAARLAAPASLLAVFDTVWLLALAAPGRATRWDRAVVAVVGAPFHVAVAAASSAGPEHAFALALVAFAYVAAASFVREGRRVALIAFLVAVFGLPLGAYVGGDLLGLHTIAWLHASPLTAPTLLARAEGGASAGQAWPALAAGAAVIAIARLEARLLTSGRTS